jgi:hypothetical protein
MRENQKFLCTTGAVLLVAAIVVVCSLESSSRADCSHLKQLKKIYDSPTPDAPKIPCLKIGILLLHNDRGGKEFLEVSMRNKQQYAALHGYSVIDASDMIDPSRPVAWSKLTAIKHHLSTYDYVVWMDLDVLVMDMEMKLEWIMFGKQGAANWDILMSQDWNGPNTGVFIVKSSDWSRWFLQHLWEQEHLSNAPYIFEYEQRAFHYVLQTERWQAMRHPVYLGDSAEIWKHFEFVPQCSLNSYVFRTMTLRTFRAMLQGGYTNANFAPGDFIIHFAGMRGRMRQEMLLEHSKLAEENARLHPDATSYC